MPDSFIGLVESINLAGKLGRLVMRSACAQFGLWRSRGVGRDAVLRVNVSPMQLVANKEDTFAIVDPPSLMLAIAQGMPLRMVMQIYQRSPNAVILPNWTVSAIAQVPGGAHPSYAHGYYVRDNAYYIAWDAIAREREGFLAWMKANVLETGPQSFAAHARRLAVAD